MQVPPEITYEGVEKTSALDDLINKNIAKLEKICDYIVSVHVAIGSFSRRHRTGNYYRVRIDLRIPPRHEIVVKRTSETQRQFEPLPAIIRRTFASAEKQLESLVEKQRNEVKAHTKSGAMALVDKIFRDEDYGFLRTADGQQMYFHKNSCLQGEWELLQPGTGVRYTEQEGEKGPQASSIEIVDRRGLRESQETAHDLPTVT